MRNYKIQFGVSSNYKNYQCYHSEFTKHMNIIHKKANSAVSVLYLLSRNASEMVCVSVAISGSY